MPAKEPTSCSANRDTSTEQNLAVLTATIAARSFQTDTSSDEVLETLKRIETELG